MSRPCDFLKRGETAEEICGIDWRRATWNGVDWPRMAVYNRLQMKRNEKKEKSLLDVLNHFTLQPAKGLDGVRDRTRCQVEMCSGKHTWQQTSWNVHTWTVQNIALWKAASKVCQFLPSCLFDFLMYLIKCWTLENHAENFNPSWWMRTASDLNMFSFLGAGTDPIHYRYWVLIGLLA